MFEAYTYEQLLADVLKNAPQNVDTRQGSIFFDAVSGIILKMARLYTDLDIVLNLAMLDTTSDEYLDLKASEYGMERLDPIKACYFVTFVGTTPEAGERFFANGLYFALRKDDKGVCYLECETSGEAGNYVYEGTPAIPVNNIPELKSATFGDIYVYGAEAEADENLRKRIKEKIAGPAENGNKQHYKTWCESVDGVGSARIFPLWNGPNTVKGVLINSLGLPCDPTIVQNVQNYIDPATKGYTANVGGKTYVVGDGLGEGVANLGAHFTAAAAESKDISISFDAELNAGADQTSIKDKVTEDITLYFKQLVTGVTADAQVIVRISEIGAVLSDIDGIIDYYNLKLNGSPSNIIVGSDGVPVLTEVEINVL